MLSHFIFINFADPVFFVLLICHCEWLCALLCGLFFFGIFVTSCIRVLQCFAFSCLFSPYFNLSRT